MSARSKPSCIPTRGTAQTGQSMSPENPAGSPQDLALMALLYHLHKKYRLREKGETDIGRF